MPNTTNIAIIAGARTPMGRYCGKLRDFTAQELAAIASKEAIKRSGIEPKEFDHAVFGNAQQTSGDSIYGARHVALKAGLPIEVPALTVNRLCGSGMRSEERRVGKECRYRWSPDHRKNKKRTDKSM